MELFNAFVSITHVGKLTINIRHCRWRQVVIRALMVAAVTAVIVGGWLVENRRGLRAWERLQAEYASKGQPLDFDSWKRLHGQAVLDESNFFGTPLLRPLFDFVVIRDRNGVASEAWVQGAEVRRVRAIRLPRAFEENDRMAEGGIDLAYWQSVFRSEPGFLTTNAAQSPARDVLEALGKWDAELRELDTASARPVGRMPLMDRTVLGLVQPCAVLRRVSEILQLRCAARMETGDGEGALHDFELNERLGMMLASDEREFCHLAGDSILSQGARMVRDGVRRHQWNQSQLEHIENLLAARHPRQDWARSLAFQRMDQCRDLQAKQIHQSAEVREHFEGLVADIAREGGFMALKTLRVVEGQDSLPKLVHAWTEWAVTSVWRAGGVAVSAAIACTPGWSLQNIVTSVREFEPHCLVWEAWARSKTNYTEAVRERGGQPRNWWSLYRSPHFLPASPVTISLQCAADTESVTRMARVACAVERYQLVNHTVPRSLGQLSPRFLPEIPRDTYTNEELIYVPLGAHSYVLDSPYRPDGKVKRISRWFMPDEADGQWLGVLLG